MTSLIVIPFQNGKNGADHNTTIEEGKDAAGSQGAVVEQKEFSMKSFNNKSHAANGLLNISLMSTNVGQLKELLTGEKAHHNSMFWAICGLLIASLTLQIVHAVLSMIVAIGDVEKTDDGGHHRHKINRLSLIHI